jgi:catechol 2,3-dioxygenase-like lactoylglutathione lyase family enzyme
MPVKVKGLAWLGIRTRRFEDTSRFFENTMELHVEHEEADFMVFGLPNGDRVEVFGPADRDHEHFETGPVVGYLVDDVEGARARLEAAGISFIGPVHSSEEGNSWSHFVGPDGNVYELTGDRSQT